MSVTCAYGSLPQACDLCGSLAWAFGLEKAEEERRRTQSVRRPKRESCKRSSTLRTFFILYVLFESS